MVSRVAQAACSTRREHLEERVFGIGRDLERGGGGVFLEPMAMAGAGDWHDIGRAGQHPSECQLRRRAVLGRSMSLQLLDQLQVTAQIVSLKPRPSGL